MGIVWSCSEDRIFKKKNKKKYTEISSVWFEYKTNEIEGREECTLNIYSRRVNGRV